jgi:hypothetical protein
MVTLQGVNISASTITAVFRMSHPTSAVVRAHGVFIEGILTSSTATELRLIGDINNDGSIVYLKYTCDTAGGTLTRSVTTVTPSVTTANAPETLLNTLIPNPPNATFPLGVPCFQYPAPLPTVGPYTYVASVGITLSVRTSAIDPQTKQYVTMTKSFLNLSPRNVLNGVTLAQRGYSFRLQGLPPNIPLT